MSETAMLLQAYSKDPIAKYHMNDADFSYIQANSVCGDELTVYLRLDWEVIKERSREGPAQMQTTAAASMLGEVIQWEKVSTVLTRDYAFIKNLWLQLSPRRRRSWVTALLATRNALHQFFADGIFEDFWDLL